MLNLYTLEVRENELESVDYEQYDGFVIAAPNGKVAREMASLGPYGYKTADRWLNTRRTSCRKIGTGPGPVRIVLASYTGA